MTSSEQKALAACVEYARLNNEISNLGKLIGDSICGCPGVEKRTSDYDNPETHLMVFYRNANGAFAAGMCGEVAGRAEMLACPACLKTHNAIQDRKALRRRLAAVKRQFTLLGRSA